MEEQSRLEIELDPVKASQKKQQRTSRFHTVELPVVRLLGFGLLIFGAWAHNHLMFGEAPRRELLALSFLLVAYVSSTWLLLFLFYDRSKRIDLGEVVLLADLVPMVLVIYFTGAHHSLLFALLPIRVADQTNRGFKRALLFAHASTVAYVLLVLYITRVEGRSIVWGVEVAKIAFIYLAGLYLSAVARLSASQQRRMTAAIRLGRELIRQVEHEKLKAQAANLAKSQFLTNMSHELRTPLNSIIGFASVLMRNKGLNLDAKTLTYTERIMTNGKHLLTLINEILDLSKIETGHVELSEETVELASLIRDTVAQLEGNLRNRHVELKTELPRYCAEVETDPHKLCQVLINLIGNAIKFTDKGTVTVALISDPSSRRPLRIEVRDTGPGISTMEIEAIFEPFHQGDNSPARRHGGTGLGLAISRTLLEHLGFRLEVDSIKGIGSTFSILLASRLVAEDSKKSRKARKRAAS